VRCVQHDKGCGWQGPLGTEMRELKAHDAACPFKEAACLACNNKCSETCRITIETARTVSGLDIAAGMSVLSPSLSHSSRRVHLQAANLFSDVSLLRLFLHFHFCLQDG